MLPAGGFILHSSPAFPQLRNLRINGLLPRLDELDSATPLLLFADAVAIWPLAAVMRRPTSPPRLAAEACGTTLAVIALVRFAGTRRVIARWVGEPP